MPCDSDFEIVFKGAGIVPALRKHSSTHSDTPKTQRVGAELKNDKRWRFNVKSPGLIAA